MIRVGITFAQIISLEEMRNRKIIRTSQDKNREYILLLAAICAIAIKIPSYFNYYGKSEDLNDMQVEDISNNTVYFAAISTG